MKKNAGPLGALLLTFAGVLTLLTALPRLTFTPSLELNLSDRETYDRAADLEDSLGLEPPLVLIWEGTGADFAPLTARLDRLEHWDVRGAWNTAVPETRGEDLVDVPLWSAGVAPEGSPYDRFFWSPDYRLWKTYLQPRDPARFHWEELETLLAGDSRLALAGEAWADRGVLRSMERDLTVLLPLSAGLLFLILYLLTRQISASLFLGLSSLLPALGSLVPFALAGRELTYGSLVAPFLVMAISTTYTIHVWHHHVHHGYGLRRLLREKGRPLAWAGGITVLGFVTMTVTPVVEIRWLGLAMITGLAWVLVWILGVLPQWLRLVPPSPGHRKINLPDFPGRKRYPRLPWAVLGAIFVLMALGWPSVRTGLTWKDLFYQDNEAARGLSLLEAHGDALEPWILAGDAREQGFWWDPEVFRKLASWKEAQPAPENLWDPVLVLGAVNRSWGGGDLEDSPLTAEGLAELTEFIPRDLGLPPVLEVDGTRAVLYFFEPETDPDQGETFRRRVEAQVKEQFPQVNWTWAGARYRRDLSTGAYAEGQMTGLILEFLFLLVVVALGARRHPRLAAVPLIPLLSLGFILGLSGHLNWRITPALSLVLAGIAGISIDDALLWVFLGAQESMRKAVIQTTAILCLLIGTLTLSSAPILFQLSLLTVFTLVFSALVVLFVLPWKSSEKS